MKTSNKYLQFLLVVAIIIVVNIIASFLYTEVDLTDDQRFTLSESTKAVIAAPDDNITIKVLLDGEFPSGFKRLQSSVKDLMDKLRDINPNIVYEFEDPSEGSPRVVEQRQKMLIEEKIVPVSLSYSDGTQLVQKAVFPFAIVTYKAKKYIINLLEEQKPGDDEDVILNKSVALLEYKFANAFQKLQAPRSKNVLFTQGNEEWDESQTFRLESEIRRFHKVGRIYLDSLMKLDSTIDLLVVAGPKTPISIQNQFKIDQYVMNGGKVLWLLDKFHISLDSISKNKFYIPTDTDSGVDNLLFKYGARIMPDLIMDLECSYIPQVIGMAGDKPQTKLFPWYYHTSAATTSIHPIVKNVDRINMFFPSTIDTIKTDANIKKTILLTTSKYSRSQLQPMRLTFEILKTAPDPSKFNGGQKPLAVLLEGQFESFFKNRLTPDVQSNLEQMGVQFIEKSKPTKQIVISDSDFAKNLVNTTNGQTEDIGYNKWERKYYKGNKDFVINMIEYMLDDGSILESRSKEIKLRLLDAVKTKDEKTKWQFINVGLPVVLLAIFGIIYHYIRRRRFTS
ncbi:MAG TPA: gliding motility-associated ABC transporter substrate-binding protein GldG [Saprospiraceae bacterium]|mgnify:CR=1 FL=1|nr:gliding motility-associated ABC transporter substrate-binding protein GldG [Saprospiraceae bacterium]